MSVQGDDVQGYALGAVFGIVVLVLAGVLALATWTVLREPRGSAASPSAQHIYFAADGEAFSGDANELLARIADAVRSDDRVLVVIAGVRDAAGDTAPAHRRALRVRHALEANGVAPAQLVLSKPVVTTGHRDARRVDITLQ